MDETEEKAIEERQRRIRVEVTEEDILNGKRGKHYACPIAHACRRLGIREPYVNTHEIVGAEVWDLPKRAQQFIEKFDEGQSVEPFSFTITRQP